MSLDMLKLIRNSLNDNSKEENIELIKVKYLKKSDKLNIIIKSNVQIKADVKNSITNTLSRKLGNFKSIVLTCCRNLPDISVEEISKKYWVEVVASLTNSIPTSRDCLIKSERIVEGNTINIKYGNKFLFTHFKYQNMESNINSVIMELFGIKCSVKLIQDENAKEPDYSKNRDEIENVIIKDIIAENKKNEGTSNKNNTKNSYDKKNANYYKAKYTNPVHIQIAAIDETSDTVSVTGDVFKVEMIETKTGKKILIFNITDYSSSITVKFFLNPKNGEKIMGDVAEGEHIKVTGEVIFDPFVKELIIKGKDVQKLPKPFKMDSANKKRVELHLHSQMSAMDAITPVGKLIKRAAQWGHKAIAITDHGVVQAYPEAMEEGKKNKIKILYGIEAYYVDDGVPIIKSPKKISLDDTYVAFDLETTGLSCSNDCIIEIGAVKIKDGHESEYFNCFVNPGIPIPYKIVELTGINDEMVKDADSNEVALRKFKEFVGDSVLCAHNANFDVSFIKISGAKIGIEFNNPVLDTIPLSQYMFPELKRFKLNTVCKHLNIVLENHHRAVDDASAAAKIMLRCFKDLKEKGIFDTVALNSDYLSNVDIKKLQSYHLIILVKNMVGLKNLYKLVSKSNLDYFYKKPRMPRSVIEEFREGLIIGSACEAGELYRSILEGKTDDELKKLTEFYDYLEIQPLGNNQFLINNGRVKGAEELQDINKTICALGDEMGKPVVATCDVHFMDLKDEVFRKILMYGQGYSDAENQPPLYFRTTKEMLEEFSYLGDKLAHEVVIDNTIKIADMIEDVKPIPDETFPPKIDGAEEEIKEMTLSKAHELYGEKLPEIVEKRLDKELNSIINNGYAVLYLIAEKLVAKSISDGYLVGSRGSVGSSFVATMCGITEVNGLPPHYLCPNCTRSEFIEDGSVDSGADLDDKLCPICGTPMSKQGFDIPFETFLGFSGDKEPDIDLNFSSEYQGVILKYTEVLFGKGHVFRAGTIGTIAEKTAFGFVRKYIDGKELQVSQAEISRLTLGCTGIKRTTGQHPGGVMVVPADNEIFNFTPIQHPADADDTDVITTHFDYHSISGRLLKLDILGHDDPTVLRMLQDITGLDPKKIPLGDAKVLSLFTSPDALGITKEQLGCEVGTFGLPEFGTKFVRQMLSDTSPKTFSDLVRISGLSHGTDVWLNNASYYIKEGFTTLKNCISTRDDIMVYLLHKKLPPKTAFTIMEKVRKGKGLTEEREQTMRDFNVPDWYIESCKKIKYMFPKGHAVAYVMMALRIAYFKVYYPSAYYAAYFTVRASEFDADLIVRGKEAVKKRMNELEAEGNNISIKDKGLLTCLEICYEMYLRGIVLLKVDLYKSNAVKFKIEDGAIRPPIKSLTGVGENAAKNIVEARKSGEFISKEDLRKRAKVTKTVISTMDNHGCLSGMQDTNQISLFNL